MTGEREREKEMMAQSIQPLNTKVKCKSNASHYSWNEDDNGNGNANDIKTNEDFQTNMCFWNPTHLRGARETWYERVYTFFFALYMFQINSNFEQTSSIGLCPEWKQ